MIAAHRATLYFHTLRYLKWSQIQGRVALAVNTRLGRASPDLSAPPPSRRSSGRWQRGAARRVSMIGPARFRFLNVEHTIERAADWNSPAQSKLWIYNLHYFDDLNALDAPTRRDWHSPLIDRWIAENAPGAGNGWEPYPVSLRLVNWFKWSLSGAPLSARAIASAAVQTRWLEQHLEHHLLGNHLFANAKALAFAGCWFEGAEADRWFAAAMTLLKREVREQILADGGHFERSPMYHALALEDMLDLLNLAASFPERFAGYGLELADWQSRIEPMRSWLAAMTHPDGEIAFFNDAAIGIAPSPSELDAYAARLGFSAPADLPQVDKPECMHLAQSGYIRARIGDAVLFIDAAAIGPDYLPGHAHADTLSFELSIGAQRVVVNTGTSRYGLGPERERERGTAAHSTVEIDGADSSEVWSGFRVARRAYPFDVSIERGFDSASSVNSVTIEAAHDGYRRLAGRPIHRRRWHLTRECLEVSDRIEGVFGSAIARVYFHPAIERTPFDGELSAGDRLLKWVSDAPTPTLERTSWHPEFGASLPNQCLLLPIAPGGAMRFVLDWTPTCTSSS